MRLRYIETVHFGKSELTNFRDLLRRRPEFGKDGNPAVLRKNDVVVFVSKTGNQMLFVSGFVFLKSDPVTAGAKERKPVVLRSVRLRLPGNVQWNPLMLADYAREVGIELKGLELYEEYIKKKLAKG